MNRIATVPVPGGETRIVIGGPSLRLPGTWYSIYLPLNLSFSSKIAACIAVHIVDEWWRRKRGEGSDDKVRGLVAGLNTIGHIALIIKP